MRYIIVPYSAPKENILAFVAVIFILISMTRRKPLTLWSSRQTRVSFDQVTRRQLSSTRTMAVERWARFLFSSWPSSSTRTSYSHKPTRAPHAHSAPLRPLHAQRAVHEVVHTRRSHTTQPTTPKVDSTFLSPSSSRLLHGYKASGLPVYKSTDLHQLVSKILPTRFWDMCTGHPPRILYGMEVWERKLRHVFSLCSHLHNNIWGNCFLTCFHQSASFTSGLNLGLSNNY